MGAYVNPRGKDKEVWLEENGTRYTSKTIPKIEDLRFWKEKGKFIVCLVDNGPFTAAAIAFSEAELRMFTDQRDTRPKSYYVVDINKLYEVSNLDEYYPRNEEKK